VGNNTPVFFIRDPLKFSDFIHSEAESRHQPQGPRYVLGFPFLTPESIHQVTVLFSDRGTPRTYRNMNGYSSHTYKWYNAKGESSGQVPFQDRAGIQTSPARRPRS